MRKNGVLLLKVTAVIVAVEVAVMSLLPFLGVPGGRLAIIVDAALLAAVTAPIFYFWIFREMSKKTDLQQAHKELDLRFQALLDNELVGIYVIKDGRFIYVNQAFAAIFGYAQHELLALGSFLDLVSEEDRAKVQEQVRSREEGRRRTSRYTALCRRFGGTEVLVDIMGSVVETAEGRLVMGMLTDITERERQSRELKRNLETRQVLDRILSITLEKGSLRDVIDRAFGELFSIPWLTIEPKGALYLVEEEPEVLVLKLQRGFSEAHLESCSRIPFGRCLCGKAARGQEYVCASSDDSCHETVVPGVGPHGHYCVPIVSSRKTLGLINLYIKAGRPADDRERDFLKSVADILAGLILRKRAEEQQALLYATIEQAGETVVITDSHAVILYVNPAFTKVTGYSREEALGKTPRLLKSGRHDEAFYKELWETLLSGQVWRGRLTNRKKDGSLYFDESVISPVLDPSGRIANYVAVRHDVTAEVGREEQLRQSQKMEAIGLLAGGVAHDVNNMLTLIVGYNYLLEEGLKEGDPLRPFAGEIGRAVEVGASLTRQLLAVSRRQSSRPKALDLNALAIETTRMLRRLVGADIEMETVLFPSLWPVRADSGQLEQVLLNFVVNARDAMPEGGKILIETANLKVGSDGGPDPSAPLAAGPYVMLSVRDTGKGMDEAVQKRIFEPFFTTKEPGRGTGLGLSTVLGIVQEHGGSLSVESAPGRGSIFRVYLPKSDGAMPSARDGRDAEELRGGDETILVLEDHPDLRQLAALTLREKGYRVLVAGRGIDALRLPQREGPIHLVLADVILPDMACKDVLAQLRQSLPDLKVVYMSGYGGAAATQAALDSSAVLLDKPFTPAALLRAVRAQLDAA